MDLKDAYLHVPLHPNIRPWFRYRVLGEVFQWRTIPFGFKDSPRMFQKLVVEGLTPLRSQGLRLVIYLDDILLISPSYSQCLQEANLLVQLLLKLGFVVNLKKSELTPTQEKTFLGVAMDSRAMSSLPPAKVKAFKKRIASMLGKATGGAEAALKEWQSIVGTLVSMGDCIPAIRLHLNSLMEVQARAIRAKTGRAIISEEAKRDLQWWKENLELWNGKSIIPRPVDLTWTWTPATWGWGSVRGGRGRGDASPPLLSGGGPHHQPHRCWQRSTGCGIATKLG